jgi:hypothetical protein
MPPGQSRRLHDPLQDLARQPLFLQLLTEEQPAKARATLQALTSEIAEIYSAAVLTELIQLLEAAIGNAGVSDARACSQSTPSNDSDPLAFRSPSRLCPLFRTLRPLAPGLALAVGSYLALAWLGTELERVVLENTGWSVGALLLVALFLSQLLTRRWLSPWRSGALLDLTSAVDARRAWRWLTAPWVHASDREALLNAVVLAAVIGTTALPQGEVMLRYSLISLASLALTVWASRC